MITKQNKTKLLLSGTAIPKLLCLYYNSEYKVNAQMFSLEKREIQIWNRRIKIGNVSTNYNFKILPLIISGKETMYYLLNKKLVD